MALIETAAAPEPSHSAPDPMVALLAELKTAGYRFVTPSIPTHGLVVRRPGMEKAQDLRGVFGWNLPFEPAELSPRLVDLMRQGGLVRPSGDLLRSKVRVSSLGDDLFLHSEFPTEAPDAVFFGPDTYRFASFLREALSAKPSQGVVVDVGAGAGAGAITAARCGAPSQLVLLDVNTRALELAQANLAAAGLFGQTVVSDGLAGFSGGADLIVANPPFIAGASGHPYRDGGDLHGCRLSLEWAIAGLAKLKPGGRLLLYTGSAIIDGEDPFLRAVTDRLSGEDVELSYREIDPDIYGGLLGSDAYADAERIAAVGLSLSRP